MTDLPGDYLERVYAGVLGKLIGVYLGRPFENWTYERILSELGPIDYYINDRLNQPLVVTDDDIGGTFTFIRALEDHGITEDLTSEQIGETWLNYLIEHRAILWWGGNGNSTEHTAWLNLRRGIKAPASGAIATNGQTIAEQIGAQIFIDGWALVTPGRPALAARLAQQAARVSHDGEAVHAAMLWAAMESAAFTSSDIEGVVDIGLTHIPSDSLINRLVTDIRKWRSLHPDWRETRALIEANYGYNKYRGNCHVVPNHALMLMAILYAPHDFQRAMTIVNTSGWDTDCNAGNVGCLLGIMLGLDGLSAGPDWRGPIADRMLISSADGGNAVSDAVTQASYIANLGRQLAGEPPETAPKGGAKFHFSLPGSRQGFRVVEAQGSGNVGVENVPFEDGRALAISFGPLTQSTGVAMTTPCFAPPEVVDMRTYDLMASPTLYAGQVLRARVAAPADSPCAVEVRLRLRVYGEGNRLVDVDGPSCTLSAGEFAKLSWRVPDTGGQPIGEVGVAIAATDGTIGRVMLDYLRWDGAPELTFRRPKAESDFWRRAWVNAADMFTTRAPQSFRLAQSRGEGLISIGTRQWQDLRVRTEIVLHLGDSFGLALRVQGLRRYYGVRVTNTGALQIVRVRDGEILVLASSACRFGYETALAFDVTVRGTHIVATVGGVSIGAKDRTALAYRGGGVGLFVHEGAISADWISVAPPDGH